MLFILGLFIGIVLAAGCLVSGFVSGVAVEKSRKPKPLELPKPNICGCGHHKSYHRDGTGRCKHVASEWLGEWTCDCQQFIEDRPILDPFVESARKELGL
jgi:hypothetical protein